MECFHYIALHGGGGSEERHQNDGNKYDSSLHTNAMFELLLKINFSAVRASSTRPQLSQLAIAVAECRGK